MKASLYILGVTFIGLASACSDSGSYIELDQKKIEPTEVNKEIDVDQPETQEISFDINMEELYGNWVLIGVGDDPMGPGIAPYGELLFAFTENGEMTVATDGEQELIDNLAGIPSPYSINGTSLCSDDIVFNLQFKEGCCEIIRLNQGRMSISIDLEVGSVYKHFVKLG
jgi:hypothetical protein